jgi:hypothetical protein
MLLVAPFALYCAFFAFLGGALPNAVIMAFDIDSFSRRLFCHLNHTIYIKLFEEKLLVLKIIIKNR